MSKPVRITSDVAVRIGRVAELESRSFANTVNMLLVSALEDGGWENGAVLTERGGVSPTVSRADKIPSHVREPRSVSAESVPSAKDNTGVRPHMKKSRPAVECPSRVFVDGVCPDCGAEQ